MLLGARDNTALAGSKQFDTTGAESMGGTLGLKGRVGRVTKFTTSLSIYRGRRPMLARWRPTATMVVAVMSSMVAPVAGGVVALIIDSQEDGVGGVLSRRRAIREA